MATQSPLPPDKARELLKVFAALPPVGNVAKVIDRKMRFDMLDAVTVLSRGQEIGVSGFDIQDALKNLPNLDWNEMLRHTNRWCDRMVKPLWMPKFEGRSEAEEEFYGRQKELSGLSGGRGFTTRMLFFRFGGRPCRKALSRGITDILMTVLMPVVRLANNYQDEARMTNEIERLAVALACFKAEQRRWPASLDELSPSLMKVIPTDRFSTKPLIYKADEYGYVLYSLGINQCDDSSLRDSKKHWEKDKDDIVAKSRD